MQKRAFLILIFFHLCLALMSAQTKEQTSFREGISITPMMGVTMFYGDAGPKDNQGYAYGLMVDKEFWETLGVRLGIDRGNIQGTYELNGDRIYEGYADYSQYGVSFYLNVSRFLLGYYRYRRVYVNVCAGGGLLTFNETNRYLEGVSKVVYGGGRTGKELGQIPFIENLHSIDGHGFGNTPFWNAGLMIDYKLSKYWFIKLDASFNHVYTSRMDGVVHYYFNQISEIYYDPNERSADKFKQLDAFGPVSTPNEYFYTIKLGLKYRFSYRKRDTNTGAAKPSDRKKWKRLPSNQFFENIVIPFTDTPKVIR